MLEISNAFQSLDLKSERPSGIESPESMAKSIRCPQTSYTTAPVHTLPPEITSMIFSFLQKRLPPSDARKLPVKLCHVSQYWRNVAFGGVASFLWADIDFSPPWVMGKISMYLEGSGTWPFTLNCVWPEMFDVDSPEAKEVFSLIGAHLARCRAFYSKGFLTSDLLNQTSAAIFDLFMNRELPLLEAFSMERINTTSLVNFVSPVLTNLRLGRVCYISPDFHFASLTTIHLAIDMEYDEFIHIMKSCRRLVTLAVYDDLITGWPDIDQDEDTPFPAPVFLPELRSIQIYGNMRSVSELLWSISAPLFTDLVIAPVVANDLMSLGDFCKKGSTFPLLTTLTLAPAHGYAFEVLPIAYKCFPKLEHLAFANIYAEPFQRFFCDESEDLLWPHLKTFALRGLGPLAATPLEKMVSLRKGRGHPLEKLYLDETSLRVVADLDVEVECRDVWGFYQRDAFHQDEVDRFLGIDESRDGF
ncbi:hypothetical protein BDZ94DRAFT_1326633 [Collybia nuda]|uniref:F-box domain-containing protein n=1 Tax=Collybia nuda TaxID=64659 RepID=A0A9P5XU77_9AGAR|nr:hypothetical protein BDZ94DRAFT_1326633 [Collybia nuda]